MWKVVPSQQYMCCSYVTMSRLFEDSFDLIETECFIILVQAIDVVAYRPQPPAVLHMQSGSLPDIAGPS